VIVYEGGTPRTQHQMTNVTVRVEGPAATARSSFAVLQLTSRGLLPILAGEYLDRFERVDGTWRFTERIFDPRLFGDLSLHMKQVP
jgi:SnoaL-like domain